jgi:hypothetical protein
MAHPRDQRLPDDLRDIAARLRDERPEPTPLELDRMKLLAMRRASQEPAKPQRRSWIARSRLASPALAAALLLGGLAAIAGGIGETPFSSGGSNASSANSQYCPPSSPAAGKPKKQPGGNKCGQPTTTTTTTTTSTTKKKK